MVAASTGGLAAGEHVGGLVWLARQLLDWTTIYYLGGFAYPLLESVRAASAADAIKTACANFSANVAANCARAVQLAFVAALGQHALVDGMHSFLNLEQRPWVSAELNKTRENNWGPTIKNPQMVRNRREPK